MKLEKGKIPPNQLAFLMIGFIFGSSIILSPAGGAGRDAWIALLFGMIQGLFFAGIFVTLALRFPGKTIVEINHLIFGPYLGRLISVAYLWYFFHLGALVLRNFGDFLTGVIFPETPISVFLIIITLICGSAVRNGIEVIARTSIILAPITIISILFNTVLDLGSMDFTRLLPILDLSMKEFLWASHGVATFPFGETVVFLMIIAFVSKPKKVKFVVPIAFLVTGSFLIIASIRNVAVLGGLLELYTYPAYVAVRHIDLFDIITRLEILVAVNFFAMGYLKVGICYYAVSLGTAQLLNMRTYLPLVLPIGILMISLSLLQFETMLENIDFAFDIYPIYALPFQLLLPLLSLIVAIARGLPTKKKGVSK